MSPKQFHKKIIKKNIIEIASLYFIYSAALIGGLILAFNIFNLDPDVQRKGSLEMYLLTLFIISSGGLGLYLIPRRYKLVTLSSKLPLEQKDYFIGEFITSLKCTYIEIEDSCYYFVYQKAWWKSSYSIYLTRDDNAFYFSVQLNTNRGIIDFGETERFRKKIKGLLEEKVAGANI